MAKGKYKNKGKRLRTAEDAVRPKSQVPPRPGRASDFETLRLDWIKRFTKGIHSSANRTNHKVGQIVVAFSAAIRQWRSGPRKGVSKWGRFGNSLRWVGLFATLYTLFNSFVTMTAGEPLNKRSPLSAPITMTNASKVFTLRKMYTSCHQNGLAFKNPGIHIGNNIIVDPFKYIPELSPGNQDTIFCEQDLFAINPISSVLYADVTVTIYYKLGIDFGIGVLPIPCYKYSRARFKTITNDEGKLKWTSWGLKDPPIPLMRPPGSPRPTRFFAIGMLATNFVKGCISDDPDAQLSSDNYRE